MQPKELIGLIRTDDTEFAKKWTASCLEAQQEQDEWIKLLRLDGIKAAHPDDGWVNRQENKISLVNPQFNDGVNVNSIVAIGDPDKYRLVIIIKVETGSLPGAIRYHWEELPK